MRVRINTLLPAAIGFVAVMALAEAAAAQCNSGCEPPPDPCGSSGCGGGGSGGGHGGGWGGGGHGGGGHGGGGWGGGGNGGGGGCGGVGGCGGGGGHGGGGGGGRGNWNSNNNWNNNTNYNLNQNFSSNVNVNVNVNNNTNVGRGRGGGGGGGGDVIVVGGGGGGAFFSVESPAPTMITGLNVDGGMRGRLVQTPYQEVRRAMRRVVIQAVCIDDRNVPHPASQVRPDRDVAESYEGEIYRCLAGSFLQVTIASYDGQISFDGGETMICAKGEALWHGGGGNLECRTQRRERDCNERSLLRRYGAGVKILTMYREEIYTAYREEMVEESFGAVEGGYLNLDGGVGGRVF